MQTLAEKPYVTLEEFQALPETTQHLELVEGEILMAPAPSRIHQKVLGRLFASLQSWAAAHPPAWAVVGPVDILFGRDTVLQPDLSLFLAEPSDPQLIRQIPELVVEVISSNRAYDRMAKRLLYMRAAVAEYWMVDPHNQTVELSTSLTELFLVQDRLESRVAPGWGLPVAELWRP